jgi:hypothetical protein
MFFQNILLVFFKRSEKRGDDNRDFSERKIDYQIHG